jgi:hypothetical protein
MYVCMFVCIVYVYIYVYTRMYVYIFICIYVFMYICTRLYLYTSQYNYTSLVHFPLAMTYTVALKYRQPANHFLLWSQYTLIPLTDLQCKDKRFYWTCSLTNWSVNKSSLNWQCTSAKFASSSSCVQESRVGLLLNITSIIHLK